MKNVPPSTDVARLNKNGHIRTGTDQRTRLWVERKRERLRTEDVRRVLEIEFVRIAAACDGDSESNGKVVPILSVQFELQ
jgi:hypothetical protein